MSELLKTSTMVKALLEDDERCRNSDSYLYLKVVSEVADIKGIDLRSVSIPYFLLNLHGKAFPPFETVRRARQKVQARHPELCPSNAVSGFRAEAEKEYRAFARCDV